MVKLYTKVMACAVFSVLASCITFSASPRADVYVGAPLQRGVIPGDFIGLSFEIMHLHPEKSGRYMFSPESSDVIALFKAAGIKNMRFGGGSMENNKNYWSPTPAEIDKLFAFAQAIDAKVIYSFPLLKATKESMAADIATAKHIWKNYKSQLDSFSLGNEPDWRAYHTYPGHIEDPEIVQPVIGQPGTAFPSYIAKWRVFADALLKEIPDARLSGPDAGSNYPVPGPDTGVEPIKWSADTTFSGMSWSEAFARAEKDTRRNVVSVLPHDYVGQGYEKKSIELATSQLLSKLWTDVHYPLFYYTVLARVQAAGFPYRMTECNDHTGGVDGVSNAYVSALWLLDYAHWHAEHGAIGLNFHNRRWINTTTITLDKNGVYKLNPKAYGMKAFTLGAAGRPAAVSVMNPENVNMTAYAVAGDSATYVTVLNKEHGEKARGVSVSIKLPKKSGTAEIMYLRAPGNDPQARTGITLGGAEITGDGQWAGSWEPLAGKATNDNYIVEIPATSAAIIKIAK